MGNAYKDFMGSLGNRICYTGLAAIAAFSLSCSRPETVEPNCPDTTSTKQKQYMIDLCNYPQFGVHYVKGSIQGIDDIIFEEKTVDDCGLITTQYGGLPIGTLKEWDVINITGDQSAVSELFDRIGGAKVTFESWPETEDGSPASLLYGVPNTATRLHVILASTQTGIGGIDRLITDGSIEGTADIDGQHLSTTVRRDYSGPYRPRITNPPLTPYGG